MKMDRWGMIGILILSSCNSFLDVEQKGMVIPQTVEHYDELLNDRSTGTITNTLMMSPEVYLTEEGFTQHALINRKAYTWDEYQYLAEENDEDWNSLYARIAACNEIIEHIDEAESVTLNEPLRDKVKGQAYAERAKCYFALVNLYGKPYSGENKNALGVPLLLKDDITQKSKRATVGEVYRQICEDLRIAEKFVPEFVDVKENNRASRQTVFAFQAKVFLFMNEVDSAYAAIEKSFYRTPELYNYEEMYDPTKPYVWNQNLLPQQSYKNKEILWYGEVISNFSNLRIFYSSGLENELYDKENDYRYKMCASNLDNGTYTEYSATRYYNRCSRTFAVSAAEMYLLRAECYARKGLYGEAMTFLQTLREHRFVRGADCRLEAGNREEAILQVKKERLREFAFTGLHWLDLRRYQAYGEQIDTFTRVIGGKTYTLAPESNRYTCSIPRYVIGKNPNIDQNPR